MERDKEIRDSAYFLHEEWLERFGLDVSSERCWAIAEDKLFGDDGSDGWRPTPVVVIKVIEREIDEVGVAGVGVVPTMS